MTDLTKFRDLGISQDMLEVIHKKGFEEPSPIQAQAIPFLLKNEKDLIGKAQTGTGKTAAFGIPLIENIESGKGHVQALILAPTRELAVQVAEEISSFAGSFGTKIATIYGGQPIERQTERLKRGVDIVVGTPGRVLDHLNRGTLNISKLQYIVLDEADEMLNMGFIEDIETILKAAPKQRRTVLFSATMPKNIENLAKKYMNDYEVISVISKNQSKKNIEQIYFEVSQADKFEALYRIIDVEESFYGMIFCRTKLDVDEVASKLSNRGLRADLLHGDLSQGQREKVLGKFRKKGINILVATDVAARGIDVDDLTHVINYSLPQDPESYVHRIGRTGRAGKSGTAITLTTPSEYRKLVSLQKMANTKITKQTVPNVKEVIESKKQRIILSIEKAIEEGEISDIETLAEEILSKNDDAKKILAAILKITFKDELNESSYSEIRDPYKKRDYNSYDDRGMGGGYRGKIGSEGKRSYVDSKGTARLFIAKGREDRLDPKSLVDFIQKETGVDQRRIDDVRMFDSFSFFAVPFEDAERVLRVFQKSAGGKKSLVTRAKDKKK
jgi:ATP-dependent RNA helicase DeaD